MRFGGLDLGVILAVHVGVFLVPQLVRDLLGLGVDQARRQVEGHDIVERVEQLALEHLARGAGIFGLEPLLDLAL